MRANGWDVALIEWATGKVGAPFVWGQTDCTLLVAEAIDIVRGDTQHADHFRGQWSDLETAAAWSREHGVDLRSGCADAGCVQVENPLMAQRGDLVLVPFSEVEDVQIWAGHVVVGDVALSASPELGVHCLPVAPLCAMPGAVLLRVGG
jgi:hypothetical protein